MSYVVGRVTDYVLTVQIANGLPVFSYLKVKIPVGSFGVSTVVLKEFVIGSTVISGCSITTISAMYIKL